jgi:hypothetical protein
MIRRLFAAVSLIVLFAVVGAAQMHQEYLDVFTVRVKPESRGEFDIVSKGIAEANRHYNGDTWIAMEVLYGENNVVSFVSARPSYVGAQKGFELFLEALASDQNGQAGAKQYFNRFYGTTISARSELRRQRWDLSYNPPPDRAAYAKLVGEARFLRTTAVHVRPGSGLGFEANIKDLKAAYEKASSPLIVLVLQSDTGQQGTVYYLTRLIKTLGDLDSVTPTSQILGEEGYQKFMKVNAECVTSTETYISRYLPELSNPPAPVAAASPEFWKPKSKSAVMPLPSQGTKSSATGGQ